MNTRQEMSQGNKHIMITGGAGFIGSHLARAVMSQGIRVTIIDNLSTGLKENIPSGADFLQMDLGENGVIGKLKGLTCDAIFHLAGQSSGEGSFQDPEKDLRSHVHSTLQLLNWCRQKKIQRFMYASSMSVYGEPQYLPVDEGHPLNPKTFYGAAKASAEAYIRLFQTMGVNTTIFRLFSVYGPGQNLENKIQGMASIFLSYLLAGEPICVKGSKDRFRDFTYIDDVVEAWLLAYENPISFGKTYNLAIGTKTTVEKLIRILKEIGGGQNYPVRYAGSTPGDQFGVVADVRLIEKELKWSAQTPLKEGLKEMFDFEKRRLCRA